MEQESAEQLEFTQRLEHRGESEAAEPLTISERAGELGYVETPELTALRANWVEAIKTGAEDARDIAIQYQEKAEAADATYLAGFRQGRDHVYAWMMRDSEVAEEAENTVLAEAAAAGFVETEAMRAARARIAITLAHEPTEESSIELVGQVDDYHKLANQEEAKYGAKFQIGLLLAKATVWRDAGKPEFYREDLEDAFEYARGMGLDEVMGEVSRELGSLDA